MPSNSGAITVSTLATACSTPLPQEMALVAVAQFHGLMLAGGRARRHDGTAQGAALQDYVRFHGGIAARVQNFARTNRNNFSHIGPRNAVLQPVVQFGTAIHGKGLSGGASNRFQKLVHVENPLSVQRSKVLMYRTDSSKGRRRQPVWRRSHQPK